MGKQLTLHPHASTPRGHKAANTQHSPLGSCRIAGFPEHTHRIFPSPVADAALNVGGPDLSARWPKDLSPSCWRPWTVLTRAHLAWASGHKQSGAGPQQTGLAGWLWGPWATHAHLRAPGPGALWASSATQLRGRVLTWHESNANAQRSLRRWQGWAADKATSVIPSRFQDVSTWDKRTCFTCLEMLV